MVGGWGEVGGMVWFGPNFAHGLDFFWNPSKVPGLLRRRRNRAKKQFLENHHAHRWSVVGYSWQRLQRVGGGGRGFAVFF